MNIKEIRVSKHLTQREAALITGLSLRTYQNYEMGVSHRDTFKIKQIINIISKYEPYSENKGIYSIDEIKDIVNEVIKDSNIDYIYLFGSYAKGTATEKSDIDLMISDEIKGLEFVGLLDKLHIKFNKSIDLLRVDDVINNQEFISEILSTGVKIYAKSKR